jgi:predicted DNA-binding transcriptional regulator AlpA
MDLNDAIRELVKKTVEEMGLSGSSPPVELITIEETCEICGCKNSVISELIQEADKNGFPVVKLGARTIRVDKNRLNTWLRSGGLNGEHNEDRRSEVSHPRFQRVG